MKSLLAIDIFKCAESKLNLLERHMLLCNCVLWSINKMHFHFL